MKFSVKSQQSVNYKKEAQRALTTILCRLPKYAKWLLGKVIGYRADNGYLYASQESMGCWRGCSRKTINKHVMFLERMGLLIVHRQPVMSFETNCYEIPEWFYDRDFQKIFREFILPARKLSTRKVTQLINPFSSLYIKNISILVNEALFSQKRQKREGFSSIMDQLKNFLGFQPPNVEKTPQKPQEYSVRTSRTNPIRSLVLSLTQLRLTKWGQIVLSAYPDDAIKHALSKITHALASSNQFQYFEAACKEWCITNNVSPDYESSLTLAKKYEMPQNANMQLRKIVNMPESFPFEQGSPKLSSSAVDTKQTHTGESMYNFQEDSEYNKIRSPKREKEIHSSSYDPHAGVMGITPTTIWRKEKRIRTEQERTDEANKLIAAYDSPGTLWFKNFVGEDTTNKLLARAIERAINE